MAFVRAPSLWILELESQENLNDPFWIIVGFQQKNKRNSQVDKNETFYTLEVKSDQSKLEQKKTMMLA